MRLKDTTPRYNYYAEFTGKHRNHTCIIASCSESNQSWYFYITEGKIKHNSLWDRPTFKTKDECAIACVNYIDTELNKLHKEK